MARVGGALDCSFGYFGAGVRRVEDVLEVMISDVFVRELFGIEHEGENSIDADGVGLVRVVVVPVPLANAYMPGVPKPVIVSFVDREVQFAVNGRGKRNPNVSVAVVLDLFEVELDVLR